MIWIFFVENKLELDLLSWKFFELKSTELNDLKTRNDHLQTENDLIKLNLSQIQVLDWIILNLFILKTKRLILGRICEKVTENFNNRKWIDSKV